MTYVFLDTETTSLLAVEAASISQQPYIVEICAIKTSEFLTETAVLKFRVKPPVAIPKQASDIHGITDDDVMNEKPFAGHYRDLALFFVGVTHLIGHNLQYDKRMLEYELTRIHKLTNFPWPPHNICTVEETFKLKGHRMSLGDLYLEMFGDVLESAHSAEADTRAVIRIYQEMLMKKLLRK